MKIKKTLAKLLILTILPLFFTNCNKNRDINQNMRGFLFKNNEAYSNAMFYKDNGNIYYTYDQFEKASKEYRMSLRIIDSLLTKNPKDNDYSLLKTFLDERIKECQEKNEKQRHE